MITYTPFYSVASEKAPLIIMISYTYYSLVAANEANLGANSAETVWLILLVDCYTCT